MYLRLFHKELITFWFKKEETNDISDLEKYRETKSGLTGDPPLVLMAHTRLSIVLAY